MLPHLPLDAVTQEILDHAFFGPVIGTRPEFGMPGAHGLSDSLYPSAGGCSVTATSTSDVVTYCLDWEDAVHHTPLRRSARLAQDKPPGAQASPGPDFMDEDV